MRWAGAPEESLFRAFHHRRPDGSLVQQVLFQPDYYRTLGVRLHLFQGRATTPSGTSSIVRWKETEGPEGARLRV